MARSRSIDTTDAQHQRIMDAAEVVIRRHGPGKTNVVDVARELGGEDIAWLDLAVDQADLMRLTKGVTDLRQQVNDALGPVALEQVLEAETREVFHDVEERVVGAAVIEDLDGIARPLLARIDRARCRETMTRIMTVSGPRPRSVENNS
jgi:hypothetical protein